MATTSPDNIRTPDLGDPYNLVPDLQTLANDVQDALIERANSYRGTSAQRISFTEDAPEGTLWADVDGEKMLWSKDGLIWREVVPPAPRVASGTGTVPTTGSNQTNSVRVNFPPGTFSSPPSVTVSPQTGAPGDVRSGVNNISATGFDIVMFRTTNVSTLHHWIAIERGAW